MTKHSTSAGSEVPSIRSLAPVMTLRGRHCCYFHFRDKKTKNRDSPGGSVNKTPQFHCRGHVFYPWLRN